MNKILLIIQREYLTRVRKKSFIIMTLLGPVLIAAMIIMPVYLSKITEGKMTKVAVLDETGWFYQKFKDQDKLQFYYVDGDLQTEKAKALANGDFLLYIPVPQLKVPEGAEIFGTKQPGLHVRAYIRSVMKNVIETKLLLAKGIDPEVIKQSKVKVKLQTIKVDEEGNEKSSNTEIEVGLAYMAGLMIYFFIFMFGSQVMKGVAEEKSNRIVEVIISSVKPFQLMTGKIIGVAMVGLTQFLLWIVLTFVFIGIFQSGFMQSGDISSLINARQETAMQATGTQTPGAFDAEAMDQVMEVLGGINFQVMILSFLFYFLGGYLLYSSLFAAIGGAIDHETETQQFMLPVSLPLIFAVIASSAVIQQPDSAFSIWLSMIPFTSPIIMMMRIPFGVPYWQIWVSFGLLVTGFIITTWFASKIYRVGILMYGKKVDYSEIIKWLKYKE
jgi:ABC-2 type transport system permease protein